MSEPYYSDASVTVHAGDCLDVLRELADASVDAVCTDPPYDLTANKKGGTGVASLNVDSPAGRSRIGTGFMGKAWDGTGIAFRPAVWIECLRVLKPGGHLLAFGGTRTSHRLACAIEDAGFEIRDSIAWLYGSGFPKSLDVSKAIDKQAGHWRGQAGEVVSGNDSLSAPNYERTPKGEPVTPAAAAAGWGTALKPAHEPVVVARKPLAGTVADNWATHGTGALNIDACRIGDDGGTRAVNFAKKDDGRLERWDEDYRGARNEIEALATGRWPANVVLDESQAAVLDAQSGESSTPAIGRQGRGAYGTGDTYGGGKGLASGEEFACYGDQGGASRFFYTAKASADERVRLPKAGGGNGTQNYGGYKVRCCDECGRRSPATGELECGHDSFTWTEPLDRKPDMISHPTVKPLSLMRWLVRLVTPPGGTVLEPFAGSGTTVEACILEGFRCIAIEREADYLPLIVQRIQRRRDPVAAVKASGEDPGLFDLFGGVA